MTRWLRPFFFWMLICGLCIPQFLMAQQRDRKSQERLQQEEIEDYYTKWVEEDVVYIITDQEKDVFQGLGTPEEKEQFIEQFWIRRDDDLSTAVNEAKEEHYRRIAYANERYTSGQLGWKTDRGRIYIIHGPPDEIVNRAGGGSYVRPMEEGGGVTSTYAFEKWRYRHIEGLGSNIELEFVDKTFTDEYELAKTPFEKDLLLRTGLGKTLGEEMGMISRADHPGLNPGSHVTRENYPFMEARSVDNPFLRYETYAMVQAPPALKYKDLKELVNVNISYENLPFKIRQDYFKLNEQQVLVPITLEFPNNELSYQELDGQFTAKIAIYGIITSIKNEVIQEFEDDVVSSFRPENRAQSLRKRSMYQKIVVLDRRVRYKMDLVLKDTRSGKTGVLRKAIIPPAYGAENELMISSLVLSPAIRQLDEVPDQDQMFVIGDVLVLPMVTKNFQKQEPLNVYLQVYGAGLDQASFEPSLRVSYRLFSKGKKALDVVDEGGESIQYHSGRRIVLIKSLPIQDLQPGGYDLAVEIQDQITGQRVSINDQFKVVGPGA